MNCTLSGKARPKHACARVWLHQTNCTMEIAPSRLLSFLSLETCSSNFKDHWYSSRSYQSQPRETAQPSQAQAATTQPKKQERAHLSLLHVAGQQQQQNGQGSHTAIPFQVLNNAAQNPVLQSRPANSCYSYKGEDN